MGSITVLVPFGTVLPLSLTGQTISVVNDVGATVTQVDTGVLANSDTVIPSSAAVVAAIALGPSSLWEIDVDGGLEPVTAVTTDANFELDVNNDIEPKV